MAKVLREDWFGQAAEPGMAMAGCLTAVAGGDEDVVLAAFGAELDTRLTLKEWWSDTIPAVALVRLGDGMAIAEYNGFEGSRPEVLREVAVGGRAASIFWNVNALVVLSCADHGSMLARAELVALDDEAGLPADLLADLVEAEQNGADRVLAGVAAVARFTGVPLERWALTANARVHALIPVLGDFHPANPRYSSLSWTEPDVVALLAGISPAAQRAVAEWAARQAQQRTGLATDPRVAAVLDRFGTGMPATFSPALPLLAAIYREGHLTARTDPSRYGGQPTARMRESWMRQHAMNALRHATVDDPFAAAVGAAESLLTFYGHDKAALATAIRDLLRQHPS